MSVTCVAEHLDRNPVPGVVSPTVRPAAVEPVLDGRVGAELQQGADRVEVTVVGSEVQRSHVAAMVRAAKRAAGVRVDAALDEVLDRRSLAAGGGPRERRATVDIAVERGAAVNEGVDRLDA